MLNLRWRDIGGDALNLADSETSLRTVLLGRDVSFHGHGAEAVAKQHQPGIVVDLE